MKKELLLSTALGCVYDEGTDSREEIFEAFKNLKEWGFEAVDYGLGGFIKGNTWEGEYDDFYEKSLEELYEFLTPTKEAAAKYDIEITQTHAPCPNYIEGNDAFNEYMYMATEKSLALCNFLGCDKIVVHPMISLDKEKQEKLNLEFYRKLMPLAKKYKVKICLENLSGTVRHRYIEGVCSSSGEVNKYIDTLNAEAGEDLFGFCLDIGHANVHAKDMNWFIRELGKNLTCLHIHDNNGIQDHHMLPYTQIEPGTNWEGMICGLRAIGYKGAISFEAFNAIRQMPADVKPELMRLMVAIGRYFRKRILE